MSAHCRLSLVFFVTFMLIALPSPARSQSEARTGSIEGALDVDLGPTRRWASRYAGGGAPVHGLQHVPAVAYLEGSIGSRRPSSEVVDVVQRDTVFDPGAIAVRVGTTVRFPNRDTFFHNVFSFGSSPRFDLGRYPEGESREVRFDVPGIVHIYCEVHEYMRAIVVVTDHPFHAVVSEDGAFRIDEVPPGEYTLIVYQPDLGTLRRVVQVAGGRTTPVRIGQDG